MNRWFSDFWAIGPENKWELNKDTLAPNSLHRNWMCDCSEEIGLELSLEVTDFNPTTFLFSHAVLFEPLGVFWPAIGDLEMIASQPLQIELAIAAPHFISQNKMALVEWLVRAPYIDVGVAITRSAPALTLERSRDK